MTDPSEYSEAHLRLFPVVVSLKVPFLSEEPIPTVDKMYKADFLIMRAIVVEVDGESHEKGKQPMKDEHRDEIMKKMGLRVIRFTNEDTFNADKCAERMREEIEKLPLEVRVEALKPAGTYWKTHVRGW